MSASLATTALAHFAPEANALRVNVRRALELAIEEAIAALDALDGDHDLEDGGEGEPWLGAAESLGRHGQAHLAKGGDGDREEQCEDEGCDCEDEGAQCDDEGICGALDPDGEPSLGAHEAGHGGSSWAYHNDPWGTGEGEEDYRSRAGLVAAQRRYRSRHNSVRGHISVRSL